MPSSSSARRKAATAALVVLTAATAGACRVDVAVGLDSDPDGTGTVTATATLDAEAVAELVGQAAGDPDEADPATRIKVDDLRDAGWTVDVQDPTETADGRLVVTATHDYDDEDEARRLLTDLGPFRDVTLEQTKTFAKTTTTFDATVDLTTGLAAFTDADLRQALEATDEAPLGVTQQQLEARLGRPLADLFALEVEGTLPGATTGTTSGTVTLGQRLVLDAEAERWNVANLASLAVAVTSGLALAATLALRRRQRQPPAPASA